MSTVIKPRRSLVLRIIPVQAFAGRPGVVFERAILFASSFKWTMLSGFFEPVFYLFAMGIGLGALVGQMDGPHGPVSYTAYIAPGLMATSAMNGAIYDSTMNVFFKMKYAKLYDTMLSTSLGELDVALGEIGWALSRGLFYAIAFQLTTLVMGLNLSWWAVLAVPACMLISLGFAACGMAAATYLKTFQQLDWVMTLLLPMFLFSTTFFPLDVYPPVVAHLVQALPLYHGIEMVRGLTLGAVDWSMLGHASYFVVMAIVGIWITSRRLGKLLLT